MTNIILMTDSYKASHWLQYPPGTQYVYSYIESRGGAFPQTVFFGLQMFIKEYLSKPITQADIDEAAKVWKAHGCPFNQEGWEYILTKHNGYLPLHVDAVPEGTVVPVSNVLATVMNTDPKCFWLTSVMETALLRAIWYPTTVATLSWHCKQMIQNAIDKSSDVPEQIGFKLHDFGARGVSSHESAGIGGAAHLVNFQGTDTIEGAVTAMKYYDCEMPAFSIPAAEHSTITSWGRDKEEDSFRNMLTQFAKPGAIVAVVSDSYDIYNATANLWGDKLKDEVIKSGATIVVRPDSGDPLTVPVEIIKILADKFGYTLNSKGYKVLPSYIRVIQGDGITYDTIPVLINNLLDAGFAIDNIAFGMGGGLLQHVNRDTLKFAMKCSAICINGVWSEVYKDPVGDHGKVSKKGQLALIHEHGKFETVSKYGWSWANMLKSVYNSHKGKTVETYTKFADVRRRSNGGH